MISKDGNVILTDGMGIDGDLAGIFRKIQQEASRTSHSTSTNTSYTASTSTNNALMTFNNKYNLDLSLIDSLTEEQVRNLLSDEEKFRKFLTNFKPILDKKEREIEEKKAELKERARANINLKKEVDNLAIRLGETHERYAEACQSYQNFMVLNSSTISAMNPENILTQIQVNLMELNDLSNDAIKNVLNNSGDQGNLDLELKECVKTRKEYHKKAILLQKLQ